jgi:hypothetical protein
MQLIAQAKLVAQLCRICQARLNPLQTVLQHLSGL